MILYGDICALMMEKMVKSVKVACTYVETADTLLLTNWHISLLIETEHSGFQMFCVNAWCHFLVTYMFIMTPITKVLSLFDHSSKSPNQIDKTISLLCTVFRKIH